MVALPLFPLARGPTLREYLDCSAAELVNDTTLRLRGSSLCVPQRRPPYLAATMHFTYAVNIYDPQGRYLYGPQGSVCCTSTQTSHHAHICFYDTTQTRDLFSHPVIHRGNKEFTIKRSGCEEVLSLDRVKPAHMDRDVAVLPLLRESSPAPPAPTPVHEVDWHLQLEVHDVPSQVTHIGRLSRVLTYLNL
ncbi:uncharacterized protein LOC142765504 [Rhipicephalus microplus]|uniref:uncharacterized protein LOC142765504 n=1 Tax=Rhipicephalus microplus TaxID=6941 RepID=UPI003F6C9FA7